MAVERAERSKGSAASTDWEPGGEGEESWGLEGLVLGFLERGEVVVKGRDGWCSGGGLAMGRVEVMELLRFHTVAPVCKGFGCVERKLRCWWCVSRDFPRTRRMGFWRMLPRNDRVCRSCFASA